MTGSMTVTAAPTPVRQPVHARIEAVDGLRAIAVCGVIAFHFGLGLPGGFLGVDFFFVISGYVITRLLLIERRRDGRIGWALFWGRRARRLMPAVLVVLVAVQLWLRLGAPYSLISTTNGQTLAALAYVSNWYAIFGDVGYWDAGLEAAPLNHLWSLAVEEQFYLAWPVVLIFGLAVLKSTRALALFAAAGAAASYASAAYFFHTQGPDRAYLGTDSRMGALLLGVLCALVLTRESAPWDRHLPARWNRYATGLFSVAVVSLTVLWFRSSIDSPWLYHGGLLLAGVCAVVVIASAVTMPGSRDARLIGSRPIVWVGRLSYSLYLWHWPIHIYATHEWTALGKPTMVACELAATFCLSALSYYLIEQPARKARPRKLVPALVTAAALALGGTVLFQPEPPPEQQTGILIHGMTP